MGAWYYADLFPGPELALDAPSVVASMVSDGFQVSDKAIELIPVDEEGHLGEFGEEFKLKQPAALDLQERLRRGEQLFTQFTRKDIDSEGGITITTLACTFELRTANPLIRFGWHLRMFSRLPVRTQEWYWRAIRDAAKAGNAVYVILSVERLDDLEDRFIEIEGRRVLDTHVDHPWGHGIWAVWVDRSRGGECPIGVPDVITADIGRGFVQYSPE